MPHFRTSGAHLYYEQTGEGPDIVWLPGGDQRGSDMRWQVEGFPDYRNTTMDPRGAGRPKSSIPRRGRSSTWRETARS